jgi:predicted nucleic acid-binding protein
MLLGHAVDRNSRLLSPPPSFGIQQLPHYRFATVTVAFTDNSQSLLAGYRRGRLTNDALIAMSAGRLGITVITANARDFEKLAKFRPFQWVENRRINEEASVLTHRPN